MPVPKINDLCPVLPSVVMKSSEKIGLKQLLSDVIEIPFLDTNQFACCAEWSAVDGRLNLTKFRLGQP